jgi:hypothetical protein
MTISMNKRRPVIIGPDTPNWPKSTDIWFNTTDNTVSRYNSATSQWDAVGSNANAIIAQIVGSAPATLDTLDEIAQALSDNPNILDLYLAKSTYASASANFATTASLNNKLDTSTYASASANFATTASLNNKLDTSTYASASANFATTTQLNNKLDTTTYAAASAGFTPGLVNIVPSSATAGSGTSSVSTLGTIILSNASTISLDGIFSSAYNNYKIIVNLTLTGGAYLTSRLRTNSGNDTTSTAYYSGLFRMNYFQGTTATDANGVVSSFTKLGLASGYGDVSATYDIFSPFDSNRNTVISGSQSSRAAWLASIGASFEPTTSFTGIWFAPSTGNMSGTISVYAYND